MREFENPTIEVKPIEVADEVALDLSGLPIPPAPTGNQTPIM
jgi:hypothetical protein